MGLGVLLDDGDALERAVTVAQLCDDTENGIGSILNCTLCEFDLDKK